MNRPGATVLSRPIKFSDGVDRGLFAHRESIGCLRRERERERKRGEREGSASARPATNDNEIKRLFVYVAPLFRPFLRRGNRVLPGPSMRTINVNRMIL